MIQKKMLRLRGLEYLKKDLTGKTYKDLPRAYQRRINECPVTLFLIQPGTPDKVKYSIFQRINTGGLVLNFQEIRNAMAKPGLRNYFESLVEDEYLKKTIGDQSKRMFDQELVLRFMAFYTMDYNQSKKNITKFLDEMMEKLKKSDPKEFDKLKTAFQSAIKRSWELFEDTAFEKRIDPLNNRRLPKNSTLFEVWTVALANLTDEEAERLISRKKQVIQNHTRLMSEDNEYFRSITFSTQKREYFRIRHKKVQQLIQEVLNA